MKNKFKKIGHWSLVIGHSKGFTLVELIIYITIFVMIMSVLLSLFARVKSADIRGQITRETLSNATQSIDALKNRLREADVLETGASVFDADQGALAFTKAGVTTAVTLATKTISIGNGTQVIKKLQLTEGGLPAADLTSDHVTVDTFRLTNVTQAAGPAAVEIELSVSNVNPGADPLYDKTLTLRTTVGLRKEIQ